MRHWAATMLVGLFGFSWIGPALFVDADSNLPACCRRDGKHHCAMMDMADAQDALSSKVVKLWGPRCPNFPTTWGFPQTFQTALAAVPQPAFAWVLQQSAVPAQAEAGYRISFCRSRQKRGPPSFLS